MKHEQCKTCNFCAWVDKIKNKWTCECFRPKFWGVIQEDDQDCESYQYCSYEIDKVQND